MKWMHVLALMLWCGVALASPIPGQQLVIDLEDKRAFINGQEASLVAYPTLIEGRTMYPLREFAQVLNLDFEQTDKGYKIGSLDIYPKLKLARIAGKQVPLAKVGLNFKGVFYVLPDVFANTQDTDIVFDTEKRVVTVTYLGKLKALDNRPVVKIKPEKAVYKKGEPIRIIDYSYDPKGQPLIKRWTNLKPAYFESGTYTVSLQLETKEGVKSEVGSVDIKVSDEVMYSPLEYDLRFTPVGQTLTDERILKYPLLPTLVKESSMPLYFSNSPEKPLESSLLYQDTITDDTRLLAYHANGLATNARLIIVASNMGEQSATVSVERLGETSGTKLIQLLGRISLMDFLLSPAKADVTVAPGSSSIIYASNVLETKDALNLMADIDTNRSVVLTTLMVEDELLSDLNNSDELTELMLILPTADQDGKHQRGTFPGAVRNFETIISNHKAGRIVIGDGVIDAHLAGTDMLTGQPSKLLGNYGVMYNVKVKGAKGYLGALSSRGGMYAGAMRVDGSLMAVPESGMLYKPQNPFVFARNTEQEVLDLEIVPASGSALPINLVFYQIP